MSVTDADLLTEIQYAVVEPPDGGVTWPSGLWTSAEVLGYLNQRQNRALKETLLLVGLAEIPVTAGTFRPALPDDWVRTVRVIWRGTDGVIRPLNRSDSFAADAAIPDWGTELNTPLVYMDEEGATLTLQLAPAPNVNGSLDLFYVPKGDPLTLFPDILNVPDEVAAGLKYGVLADMLSKDGRGRDDARAQYAEQRYGMYVEAVKMMMLGRG